MPDIAQNLIALLLVTACVGYVGWQLFKTLNFGRGKAGSCCAKGCDAHANARQEVPSGRLQFIASDSLRRKRQESHPLCRAEGA